MKNLLIATIAILFPLHAHADAYVKSSGLNGMGINETWYSGNKKREETQVDMGGINGKQITITRVDKGVVWEVDPDLRMYRERPIYTPQTLNNKNTSFGGMPDKGWSNNPSDERCTMQVVMLPGKQVIAGYESTGYQTGCKEKGTSGMSSMTMWFAPLQGTIEKFYKETRTFDTAYFNELNKKDSPAERKRKAEALAAFGNLAGQALLGLDAGKLPSGVPLKVEQNGEMGNGESGNMVMSEMLEIRTDAVNPGLFNIPAGYRKVTNEAEYDNLKAQKMAEKMGMGDMFNDMKKMQEDMPAE